MRECYLFHIFFLLAASRQPTCGGNKSGHFEAGVATDYRVEGETLVLTLREGSTPAVAQTLRERLAHVEVTISEQTLVLRGVQPQILLGQLSRVHVVGESQDSNPLGALSAWRAV